MSMQLRNRSIFLAILLFLAFSAFSVGIAGAQEEECVIPESGPWPPCATGGETPPATDAADAADEEMMDADEEFEVGEPRVVLEIDGPDGKETVGIAPLLIPFDGPLLAGVAAVATELAREGRGLLHDLNGGNQSSCDVFEESYLSLISAPIFVGAPSGAAGHVAVYEAGIQKIADQSRDFFLYCFNGGGFSELSYFLATSGYEDGINILERAAMEAAEAYGTPDAPVEAPAPTEPAMPEEEAEPEAPAEPEEPAMPEEPVEETPPAEQAPTDDGGRPDEEGLFPGSDLYFGDQYPLGAERVTLFLNVNGGTEEIAFKTNIVPFNGDDFTTVAVWSTAFVDASRTEILPGMSGGSTTDCEAFVGIFLIVSVSPRFSGVPGEYQPWVDQYNNGVQQYLNGAKDLVQWCVNGGAFSSTAHTLATNGAQNAYNVLLPVAESALDEFGVSPDLEEAFGFALSSRNGLALNAMSVLRFTQARTISSSSIH